jgi:NADH-quinone oxidoreductase subunit J
MSAELVLFLLLGILAVGSAVAVIVNRNPITSAIGLVLHFVTLAGLYLTLNAQFMAAIQVLVYAGAIMVLVVFVIMLLNLGSDTSLKQSTRSKEAFGVGLALLLGGVLIYALTRTVHSTQGVSEKMLANGTVESVGKSLFTTYVFPFEMVSLVLLAAAVGAVVLTKRHLQ